MSASLPTPPRTSHKDKENQPPSPPTPSNASSRTPRIAWSRENLHHAYSTQIRQLSSSSRAQGPQKSILKKPSASPLMPLSTDQPVREATPEPADPLRHHLYLNSPIMTLVASFKPQADAKVTLTDLTEAYSVLSVRLKTKTQAMLDLCGPIPALEPLQENSEQLAEAFQRDIGRAFIDPPSITPSSDDSPLSTPSSLGNAKKRCFNEQEVKYARDLCNLSHAAMRCFSNISVVPVLCSVFTDSQLGDILTALLAIPLAPSLPTPNTRKTYQIAVWTLQVQRLPSTVLAPAADRIAYALRRGIDGELGREGKKGSALDGLKALDSLVRYQPAIFLRPFADILSSVLSNLTSQNLGLREQAAHVLLSLSYTLAHTQDSSRSLLASLAHTTTSYLMEQHQARRTPHDPSPLGRVCGASLNAEVPSHPANSPMWALSVIASMIVLSGGDALTHPKMIKFILEHLQIAMTVKRSTVRATAGLVWRVLVWSCIQLEASEESDEKKDAGWKVVRQIIDGAIGISIIAGLVGRTQVKPKRALQALHVLNAMIDKGGKTCEEAVDILEKLLSAVGSDLEDPEGKIWRDTKLLSEPLFDGTFLQVEAKNLAFHIKDGMKKNVTVEDIRPFREAEVTKYWDVLFTIWKKAVERAPLGDDGDVPTPVLSSWQALLLTQSQNAQHSKTPTLEHGFIVQLTNLLKSYLTDHSLEWSLEAGVPSWSSQRLKLGFVRNLWITARNIFPTPVLAGAAESLLDEVMKPKYLLTQVEVRDAWAMLCAELLLAGVSTMFGTLWTLKEDRIHLHDSLKRELWKVIGHQWLQQAGPWEGTIQLLRVPFFTSSEWSFDHDELDLWIRLADGALLAASGSKIPSNTVLDSIAGEIGIGLNCNSLYAVLPFLLSTIETSAHEASSPPQLPYVLLKLTSDILVASYPPADAGVKKMLCDILLGLTEFTKTVCADFLVEYFTLVQEGVRSWVEDKMNMLTDSEFNQQVIPFYVASLQMLKAIPPSTRTLETLSPLFLSAFNRIPEPAIGPSAFKDFWATTYTHLPQGHIEYPEDFKPVLRLIQEAMCSSDEEFAPGLSQGTQTQPLGTADLTLSIVPDSLEVVARQANTNARREFELPLVSNTQPENAMVERKARNNVVTTELIPELVPETPNSTFFVALQPKLGEVPPPEVAKHSLEDTFPNAADDYHGSSMSPKVSIHLNSPVIPETQSDQLSTKDMHSVTQTRFTPKDAPEVKLEVLYGDDELIARSSQDPDNAFIAESSQGPHSSQSSCSSRSSLGKRRRSRITSRPNKRRKTNPPPDVEIISISDDEDSEQVELDLSIVVAPPKYRAPQSQLRRSISRVSRHLLLSPESPPKKRILFEAVEITRRIGSKKRADVSDDHLSETASNKRKKTMTEITKAQSSAGLVYLHDDDFESPIRSSDVSIPSSNPGRISARYITSPVPHRSRSEAYDPPSDDSYMSSSPLQRVAARRQLQRARTVPAGAGIFGNEADGIIRASGQRVISTEFLALQNTHAVITSGVSTMGLQEVLEASRLVNGMSAALNDRLSKLLDNSTSGRS